MNDRADELRSTRAPKLREDQIVTGRRERRRLEVLFRAGDASNDFIVVLEGEVEVVDDFAGEARTMGVMRAGRFVGDLNMLTGQAMYLSAVVGEGGEVLAIPRERLKEVVTEEPNFSDIILKAFLLGAPRGSSTGRPAGAPGLCVRVLLGRAVRSAYAAMDEREGRGCYAPTLVVDTRTLR